MGAKPDRCSLQSIRRIRAETDRIKQTCSLKPFSPKSKIRPLKPGKALFMRVRGGIVAKSPLARRRKMEGGGEWPNPAHSIAFIEKIRERRQRRRGFSRWERQKFAI